MDKEGISRIPSYTDFDRCIAFLLMVVGVTLSSLQKIPAHLQKYTQYSLK